MEAGKAAGCHTILVSETYTLLDCIKELKEKGIL